MKELSITFAPKRPITGKKLQHAIDDYNHFTPGITKKVKSKHIEELADDMTDVDDNSTRFHVGTVAFKVFGKVEHRGKVVGYDPVTKLYQIVYDDEKLSNYCYPLTTHVLKNKYVNDRKFKKC